VKALFLKLSCLLTVLIIAVLLGCGGDDKPTEQPPLVNFDYKRATIYAFVHDQDGIGIDNATILSSFYLEQTDYKRYLMAFSEANGSCLIHLGVRDQEGKDTISVYATIWNEGIFSDTTKLFVANDGQVFNVDFELKVNK